MTYSWDALLRTLADAITEITGVPVEAGELVPPPNPKLGDIAYGCFRIAKLQGKNPAEIATDLATKLKESHQIITDVTATGPYINISLETGELVQRIIKDVENADGGFGKMDLGQGQEVMVEYAQPNTHKEIHVGHLRNLVLGSSLVRLLRMVDWKAVAASYHGDVGAHVAKCLWWMVSFYSQDLNDNTKNFNVRTFSLNDVETLLKRFAMEERKGIPKKKGAFLSYMYRMATEVLWTAEHSDSKEKYERYKEEVSFVQQKLESHDPSWNKLWLETRRWSLEEMRSLFEEFDVKIDRQYLESEVVEGGQRIVDELLEKGIAKESQGAIVVDLEDKKLGVFLIRKSDGTSLYATKDLQLAKLKDSEYPELKKSFVVVDNRQAFYFKQLFATLGLMGVKHPTEFVGYEFVTLKSGAMSSREGNVVTLESFRDEVMAYAVRETRARHPDWVDGKVEDVAWKLMMAGVKFGMLRQDSDKIFVFDMEQALSFDGATGPYVQYAVTRLGSILRKAGGHVSDKADLSLLKEDAEKHLVLGIADFPHVIARAAQELRPSLVANWCLDMASRINDFYRDVKVLDAPEEVKAARLRLILATKQVLEKGLEVLGIPVPEEM